MKLLNVCLLAFVVAVLTPTASISADEDMTAADTKALQGDWVSIREESGGKALTKTQLKEMNKRLTVKGNKFIIKRVIMDKLGTYDGRFEFDATQKPKAYDWTGKGPNGAAIEFQGIYELSGDTFKVCYVFAGPDAKRPKEFKTAEKSGYVFVEYKRDKDE